MVTRRIGGAVAPTFRSPLVAALVSLLLPGAGQLLLGQRRKGGAMLLAAVFTCGALGLLNVVSAFDAWVMAERRSGRALQEWEFFWSSVK